MASPRYGDIYFCGAPPALCDSRSYKDRSTGGPFIMLAELLRKLDWDLPVLGIK